MKMAAIGEKNLGLQIISQYKRVYDNKWSYCSHLGKVYHMISSNISELGDAFASNTPYRISFVKIITWYTLWCEQ